MNIFERASSICGGYEKGVFKKASKDFFEVAKELREELGEDAYILDAYLSEIFAGISSVDMFDIQKTAEKVMVELEKICFDICGDNIMKTNVYNSFFEYAKKYVKSHPLDFKERETNVDLYILTLIDEFTDFSIVEIIEKLQNEIKQNFCTNTVIENFNRIQAIVGTEKIELLNDTLENRFIRITLIDMFIQCLSQQICHLLNSRDPQTSKQIFQLALQHKIISTSNFE